MTDTEKLTVLRKALTDLLTRCDYEDSERGYISTATVRRIAKAALGSELVAPHGWVLVPNDPSTPTPDYEECARQATEATGLPSQYPSAWLSIFIREINRWCQQRTRYVVKTKSASGNDMWWTPEGSWSYRSDRAARLTSDEADEAIRAAVPTDGSVAPAAVKELCA